MRTGSLEDPKHGSGFSDIAGLLGNWCTHLRHRTIPELLGRRKSIIDSDFAGRNDRMLNPMHSSGASSALSSDPASGFFRLPR